MANGWKHQRKELALPVPAAEMTGGVPGSGHAPQIAGAKFS